VQYPGRQDRRAEPLIDSEPALTEQIVRAMTPWRGGTLALFGHSMGAVLAFETARRLHADTGTRVVHLFASGRRAPSRHRAEAVHRAGDRALLAELRSLGGTNAQFLDDVEVQQMILPAVRNDYRLIECYRGSPEARVDCPITVLVGDDDPMTSLEEAEAWAAHTTSATETIRFPGGHFYLEQRSAELARTVFAVLEPYAAEAHR
jgi:pyochelin biosynthetic protein PchC